MKLVMDMTGRVVGKRKNFRVTARAPTPPERTDGMPYWQLTCTRCGREIVKPRSMLRDACCPCLRGIPTYGCAVVYMACTADRYELPIAVTDTLDEMSAIMGMKKESIMQSIARNIRLTKNGKTLVGHGPAGSYRYYRVKIGGGDET